MGWAGTAFKLKAEAAWARLAGEEKLGPLCLNYVCVWALLHAGGWGELSRLCMALTWPVARRPACLCQAVRWALCSQSIGRAGVTAGGVTASDLPSCLLTVPPRTGLFTAAAIARLSYSLCSQFLRCLYRAPMQPLLWCMHVVPAPFIPVVPALDARASIPAVPAIGVGAALPAVPAYGVSAASLHQQFRRQHLQGLLCWT